MSTEIQPSTEAGRRFAALAHEHALDCAMRADQHDRENSFVAENIEAMRRSGLAGATVPAELGGLGVQTLLDYAVGINRLGRGDGATALAANMHIFLTWFVTRDWRRARAAGRTSDAARWEELLRAIAAGRKILAALATEPGHDLMHPVTEAKRVDGGWRLSGRKSFATGSEAADVLVVTCRYRAEGQGWRSASAYLAADSAGVANMKNWDALGMRGSGSHDVVLTDCFVPAADFADSGPWGDYDEGNLAGNFVGTLGLVSVFPGIAEAARDMILESLRRHRSPDSGRPAVERSAIQHTVAETEIDLAAARAMLERTAKGMDAFFAAHPDEDLPIDGMHQVNRDFQCTKWFVNRKAIEIVDRALTLSGGFGYLSRSPLSRLYRDVRAGPFMQPFSPNEAFEYIGRVTLGVAPMVDR
jgi:L-evernosamine nitrososynthase